MPKRTDKSRNATTSNADERILTTEELTRRVPLTRVTIWRMVQEGRFPAPIQLTSSRIGWRWSAVLEWLAQREQHPERRRAFFVKRATDDVAPDPPSAP
jgi:prophage regulatory protein